MGYSHETEAYRLNRFDQPSNTRVTKATNITNSSRGIQHAWHFLYAFDFGVEVQCRGLVIACFTP
ncbi:TPA: DUF3265 domain-containing protein [Vibrio vulnificus]|nr:DUF3265 domain-containing protein [Vibrio parahaemolyticus]HDY8002475.1 DUF3265 domain-containing protein [Vibrio vulnificus]MBM5059565.1 DUF3265 domain-containing protein [Vibrio parahaemolyticus]MCQ9057942.1 DUF3265 domain-containing protein [Vibrio parahaemolyticus]HCG6170842.1 DUF3265 domain-containing protein [Vibrio parahaemolyticus]